MTKATKMGFIAIVAEMQLLRRRKDDQAQKLNPVIAVSLILSVTFRTGILISEPQSSHL